MITELEILKFINAHRVIKADTLLILISSSAYLISAAVTLAMMIYGLARLQQYYIRLFVFLFCSLSISTSIVYALKYGNNRIRPYVEDDTIVLLTTASSPSFPSGHTTTTMVIYFAFSAYANVPRRISLLVLMWAMLVAYSRLALGAHYPSDVIVGILIAFLSVLTAKKLLSGSHAYVFR